MHLLDGQETSEGGAGDGWTDLEASFEVALSVASYWLLLWPMALRLWCHCWIPSQATIEQATETGSWDRDDH